MSRPTYRPPLTPVERHAKSLALLQEKVMAMYRDGSIFAMFARRDQARREKLRRDAAKAPKRRPPARGNRPEP